MSSDAAAYLVDAQRALESQEFDRARKAIRRGYEAHPDNDKVRDLYRQIHMADGIRRNRQARDLRRDEVRALDKRERSGHRDSERVRAAFASAVASLDKALEANPEDAKVLMLKAGVLDRMDRRGNRDRVEALFARALEIAPGNEEIAYARDRVLAPCAACEDTGTCPDCQGAGQVSAWFLKSTCPTCNGKGICLECGLF